VQTVASLERDLAASRKEIERLMDSEKTARANIDNSETRSPGTRCAGQIDVEIVNSRAEVQRLDSEIATHRNRIEFNRQRAQELTELIERARRDSLRPKQTQPAGSPNQAKRTVPSRKSSST